MGTFSPTATDYPSLIKNYDTIQQKANILESALETLPPHEVKKHLPKLHDYHNAIAAYHAAREEKNTPFEQMDAMLHDNLGMTHLRRISASFTILTLKSSFRIANDAKWFDFLNQTIAPIFNFDQALTILNLPVDIFNILSVAVLGLRFLIENARILQHTFFPKTAEKETTAWERFSHEAHKYRFKMANDVVWASLNALGNFPAFFNISAPLANNLMLLCCFFDIGLLIYRYRLTQNNYHEQKAIYMQSLDNSEEKLLAAQSLKALATEHIKNTAELNISLVASGLLTVGFGIFLAASVPIFSPFGTLLCITATAIYAATGHYGEYHKASHSLQQAILEEKSEAQIQAAHQAQQTAFKTGLLTFAESLCAPILLIGTLALYWPAGLALLVGYAAYKLYPALTAAQEAPAVEAETDTARLVPA